MNHPWIPEKEEHFGEEDHELFDFEKQDIKDLSEKFDQLKVSIEDEKSKINMRAEDECETYEKKSVELKDKRAITQ